MQIENLCNRTGERLPVSCDLALLIARIRRVPQHGDDGDVDECVARRATLLVLRAAREYRDALKSL